MYYSHRILVPWQDHSKVFSHSLLEILQKYQAENVQGVACFTLTETFIMHRETVTQINCLLPYLFLTTCFRKTLILYQTHFLSSNCRTNHICAFIETTESLRFSIYSLWIQNCSANWLLIFLPVSFYVSSTLGIRSISKKHKSKPVTMTITRQGAGAGCLVCK